MSDTVEIKDGGKTMVLTLAVEQSESRGGNPQLKPASPIVAGWPQHREVNLVENGKATSTVLPLFGSFALGLTPSKNAPVVTHAAESAGVDVQAIVNAAVQAALAAQSGASATVSAPRRGRPLGSKNRPKVG